MLLEFQKSDDVLIVQEEEVRTPIAEKSDASVVCFRNNWHYTYCHSICRPWYHRYTMRHLHLLAPSNVMQIEMFMQIFMKSCHWLSENTLASK